MWDRFFLVSIVGARFILVWRAATGCSEHCEHSRDGVADQMKWFCDFIPNLKVRRLMKIHLLKSRKYQSGLFSKETSSCYIFLERHFEGQSNECNWWFDSPVKSYKHISDILVLFRSQISDLSSEKKKLSNETKSIKFWHSYQKIWPPQHYL